MSPQQQLQPAFGYMRTSSATNVGEDKDSHKRQRAVIEAQTKRQGFYIKQWFYDADVKGETPVQDRPAFMEMLHALADNGVRTVFIEDIGRFSRVAGVGIMGIGLLRRLEVTLYDGRGTDCTDPQDPMAKAMLGMMLVFAELEKDLLVRKLRGARDRKSEALGRRIEGRTCDPAQVAAAKRLAPGRSLRQIAAAMAEEGFRTGVGSVLSADHVRRLLRQP